VDAVLICTPHYSHTTLGILALENGLHVMVEKPISVHKADCERPDQHRPESKVRFLGRCFNFAPSRGIKKIKRLIETGESR
jgi:predicted dehydrogenase